MDLMATVEGLLRQSSDESLCAACLAFACGVSLLEMRDAIDRLESDGRTIEMRPACASCRRTIPSATYRRPAGKCVHCSRPVQPREEGIIFEADLYHAACLRVLVSEAAISASRDRVRQSGRLMDDAHRRVANEPRPIE